MASELPSSAAVAPIRCLCIVGYGRECLLHRFLIVQYYPHTFRPEPVFCPSSLQVAARLEALGM